MTAGQQIFEQGRQLGIEQARQLGIEQARQLGIEQARQQGIEQARQQGVQQGVREVLLCLLRHRFGDAVGVQIEQRIAAASLEQLQAWTSRTLTAVTLDELFTA